MEKKLTAFVLKILENILPTGKEGCKVDCYEKEPEGEGDPFYKLRITVPSEFVGLAIGSQGKTINAINALLSCVAGKERCGIYAEVNGNKFRSNQE